MADTKLIGNDFFLRIDVEGTPAYIVCEQNTSWTESAEAITVLCKTSGSYPEILPGGTKSGSISFTGVYVKNPTSPNLSWIGLRALLGTIVTYTFGGIDAGDDEITGNAHVGDVSLDANTNEAITFTATLTLSGEPTVQKVTT